MTPPVLIAFDMDDTLITSNTWLRFNTFLGVSNADDYRLYKAYAQGDITYAEWLTELEHLYQLDTKTVLRTEIEEILTEFTLAPSATEAVAYCNKYDIPTVIITGSFKATAAAVADTLGIDHVIANTDCTYNAQDHLIGISSHGDEAAAKVRHLETFCQTHNIATTDVLTVGDGANDIPLFTLTGNGVTFSSANDLTKQAAKYIIETLADVPPLLEKISSTA